MEKTSTGLQENVAGLLCYLGAWVTGIIFLILEPKNRFVRFHAVQSIVVFGVLSVAGTMLGFIPFTGWIMSSFLGVLSFILWIVLMVKAYQGEYYKLPVAGDLAEQLLGKL
ncbi:DUF4870 domain-containing protein [Dehalogenimonas sp. THU2]|uniref:DUF4870 domain-containing protein n=1 Tax=Dehalogenimonas sp. THU2 TaxID=3151121 RepID=UPI003218D068